MKYERITVDSPLGAQSPYVGQPGPEVDKAWNTLYKCTNLFLLPPQKRYTYHTDQLMRRYEYPTPKGGNGSN